MDEADKKQVESICWKTIFIAVVLVGIGIVIGRVTADMCPLSKMGRCGSGYSMKSCCNKGWGASRCDKQWQSGCKKDMGMCKPGCTCPKCSEKAGMCKPGCTCPKCLNNKSQCKSDPNKTGCPMTTEKAAEPAK